MDRHVHLRGLSRHARLKEWASDLRRLLLQDIRMRVLAAIQPVWCLLRHRLRMPTNNHPLAPPRNLPEFRQVNWTWRKGMTYASLKTAQEEARGLGMPIGAEVGGY